MGEREETKETLKTVFLMQKGGTGKTTICINVGGALAALGHDVLLIDVDNQGHLTEWTGHSDRAEVSMYDVVAEGVDPHEAIKTDHEEFDVLPADAGMLSASLSPEEMRDTLAQLDGDYDHILMDAPPRIDEWSDAALLTADALVIVAKPRAGAGRSVELVGEQLDTIASEFGGTAPPAVAGLVANEVRGTNVDDEMLEVFDDLMPNVWEIPPRVDLQRAANASVSIFEYSADTGVEDELKSVAEQLEELRRQQ